MVMTALTVTTVITEAFLALQAALRRRRDAVVMPPDWWRNDSEPSCVLWRMFLVAA